MFYKQENNITSFKKQIKARTTVNSLRATPVIELQSTSKQKSAVNQKQTKSTLCANSNSKTSETTPYNMVFKTMVSPGTRDAPKFSSAKPHELRRFLRLVEDLWRDAGITDDEVKKTSIGKYADQDSEEEWRALETYEPGHSWEEFKAELIENYPEAAAAERGTPARIRTLCMETRDIKLGDMPTLYIFRRAFMAEAKKLMRPPAAMSNRELVELFIGCLSESMASAVLQYLSHNPSGKVQEQGVNSKKDSEKGKQRSTETSIEGNTSPAEMQVESTLVRRPEDRYDLEDICDAAVHVSKTSQGMFNLMGKVRGNSSADRGVFMNQPVPEMKVLSDKIDVLAEVHALERDMLVNVNKAFETKFSELENMMKALFVNSNGAAPKGGASRAHEDGAVSSGNSNEAHNHAHTHKGGKSMENEKCYFCWELGHFQADCGELKKMLRSGLLKLSPEGKLRLNNGYFIPTTPSGVSIKERVERHYSRKPSQFFYGEYEDDEILLANTSKYPMQFMQGTEDAERRRVRLERELDLREREEALELRRLKLEREEKKMGKSGEPTRSTNVLDLLGSLSEEEVAAIKAARAGFP